MRAAYQQQLSCPNIMKDLIPTVVVGTNCNISLPLIQLQREILIDDVNLEETDDFTNTLGEQDRMRCVLGKLQDRERYIFCAKVLKGADFSQIAHELGMKYKSVATIYYRTAVKLRNMLGGER